MRAQLSLMAISATLLAALVGCGESVREQLEQERAENTKLSADLAVFMELYADSRRQNATLRRELAATRARLGMETALEKDRREHERNIEQLKKNMEEGSHRTEHTLLRGTGIICVTCGAKL